MNEILENLGFTQAEAMIYLTLLELGPVQVGALIERTKLQSSTIHHSVHALSEKGFVKYVLRGKIKIYQAVPPAILLKEFQDREHKFSELVPLLEKKRQLYAQKPVAEVYEGRKGVMALLNELLESAKSDDTYYFYAVDQSGLNKEIQEFFRMYDAKRKDRGLHVRGLAPESLRPLFAKRSILKMRYVSHPIPSNISICNNKMALISWSENPTGILIVAEHIITTQISFFEELWKNAKK